MTAYYNEIEPYAAQWLRNLIDGGHIARGEVDTRSIADVRADDLRGFTQLHFFAGIGGWSKALRLASWPDDRPVWTGSCPCQPFSLAGSQKGFDDSRHLWPAWFGLIRQCRPPIVFGEQVASAPVWLDGVSADLESEGYAIGAAVLPACSVDAPHKRDRLWFVAYPDQLGASEERQQRSREQRGTGRDQEARSIDVADAAGERGGRRPADTDRTPGRHGAEVSGRTVGNADAPGRDELRDGGLGGRSIAEVEARTMPAGTSSRSHWAGSQAERGRRIDASVRLLAHGIPNRVGKLRAFGNAIVPQVAAEFIGAAMNAVCERRENGKGEWICDRCSALWYGELAKTDWVPSTCRSYPVPSQQSQTEAG